MNAQQYAALAKDHLLKHRAKFAKQLLKERRIDIYVSELGEHAARQQELIERQYLERNPVPANAEYVERAAHLAQAEQVAEEMVLHDLVLVPDELTDKAIRHGGYTD